MVTVSILLNPGMSKTRELEKRRGKERARGARPSQAAAGFGPSSGPAALAGALFQRGQRVAGRTRGEPGSSEPLESRQLKAPGFA